MAGYGNDNDHDSHDARVDFENILQGILEKANAGDSLSGSQSGNDDDKDSETSETQTRLRMILPASAGTPPKPSTPSKRKRRKREDYKEEKTKTSSFIIKLFDRSVDLVNFTEDTPLYPICRAWMDNDPTNKINKQTMESQFSSQEDIATSNSEDEEDTIITSLPPPNVPFNNIGEDGKYQSPRIPQPEPQPNDSIENYLHKNSVTPPADQLLLDHLQHWRKVRDNWKQKSSENDARYQDGMNLLSEMFNRHAVYNTSVSQ
ncbi:protein lin-37 homolog isoform X1 [Ciona intestinalis]